MEAAYWACRDMSRLSKVLKKTMHPIVPTVRLQLDYLRSLLKTAKHAAMVNFSKRFLPDDSRVYVADYSSVVPEYIPAKYRQCQT